MQSLIDQQKVYEQINNPIISALQEAAHSLGNAQQHLNGAIANLRAAFPLSLGDYEIIKELSAGNNVVLTVDAAEDFMERVAVADSEITCHTVKALDVMYRFELSGYKWRDVKDVQVYEDLDDLSDRLRDLFNLTEEDTVHVDDEALNEIDVDYTPSKVDIDFSEAGNGVCHSESNRVKFACLRKSN